MAFCEPHTIISTFQSRSAKTGIPGRQNRYGQRRMRADVSMIDFSRISRTPDQNSGTISTASEKPSTRLVNWLVSNGMHLSDLASWGRARHPLAISDETTDEGEPSGRGLIAIKSINQGESLFEVPEPMVITKKRVVDFVPDLPENVDDYVAIAIFLIQERSLGKDSFWDPYIDILPKENNLIPLFLWSDEELVLLQGSPSVSAARSLQSKLKLEYETTVQTVFENDRERFSEDVFTFDAWKWAFGILFSRAIMLQQEGCIALVPYADLINHSCFCSTFIDMQTEIISRKKHVVLYTDRGYNTMDQVYVSYGPKSNSELLLLYGFLIDRNPYDSVEISVSLNESDPLFEKKKEYLVSSGVEESATFPLYFDRYPMELIEFMRFCVSSEHEFNTADFGDYVSEENESSVAEALIDACTVALDKYSSTIEEDKTLLSDTKMYRMLDLKTRCAVRQRYGEKRILQRTINNTVKERAEPSFMFNGPESTN